MDIGFVTEYYPQDVRGGVRGGVEFRVFNIASRLSKKHEVTVYTTSESGGKSGYVGDVWVERIPPHLDYSQKQDLIKRTRFMLNVKGILKKKKHDLLDAQSFLTYPCLASSKSPLKVATYHDVWLGRWIQHIGYSGLLGEALERYVLSLDFDHFIANSEYTKTNLVKSGINASKISVIHNGVDLEALRNISAPKKEQPTISVVARLVEYKNVGDVLDAASLLLEKHPNLRVEVVGSGPKEESLRQKAKHLGLEERVVFHGFIRSHLDVMRIVKSSHAFVLPSTVEGFGITTIEAVALEIPYAASDIPPIREATGAGTAGLLYPPRNINALASCLDRILSGEVKPDPKFAEENYGWDALALKTEETYLSLSV